MAQWATEKKIGFCASAAGHRAIVHRQCARCWLGLLTGVIAGVRAVLVHAAGLGCSRRRAAGVGVRALKACC
jgi:hypothetical protein